MRNIPASRLSFILAALLGIGLAACGRDGSNPNPTPAPPTLAAELTRTSHGIPHIQANDFRGLGYGIAYAYAQDNICMFADSLLTARGERSQFFGPDAFPTRRGGDGYGAASGFMTLKNDDSDFFFKGYLDIEQLKAGYAAGSKDQRDLLEGYVAGYNRYVSEYAGRYPAACNGAKWVRPISVDDMILVLAEKALHASGEVFAREIVTAARDPGVTGPALAKAARFKPDASFLLARLDKLHHQGYGSNALAVGKDLSANGRGLLLGNPHFPWTSTDRFYQAHLTVPGRYDAMGVVLGGMPAIVIGFNRDIAWTHTVTAANHFTTYKLTLDPTDPSGTTYLVDGERNKMTSKTVTVDVLLPDGTTAKRSKTFWFGKQGAVLVKPEAGLNWTSSSAFVLADPNRNNTRMLEQWIGIGSSTSVRALKTSLDTVVGLPWVNTLAADRNGEVLYADASVVPHMTTDKFAGSCLLVPQLLMFDGSRTACAWGQDANAPAGIFSPANAPSMLRTDYVANSNDSYWLTNARQLLTGPAPLGYSPLYGRTGIEQRLRTRIGFLQFEQRVQARQKLQLTDLQELLFVNRVYAAELVLPELLPACSASTDALIREACGALSAWDRHDNIESRGAVLFREFWNMAANIPNKWAVPLNPADPVNTPNGIAPAAMPAMLAALKSAAQKLQSVNVPFDGKLGDYQTETRNGMRTPLHGGVGDIDGSYNSLTMNTGLTPTGYNNVYWGTSYVQTVTFDENGPVAQGMLVYGQSTDPASAYYADQLENYSRKEWPVLPFSQEKIKADPAYKRVTLQQ